MWSHPVWDVCRRRSAARTVTAVWSGRSIPQPLDENASENFLLALLGDGQFRESLGVPHTDKRIVFFCGALPLTAVPATADGWDPLAYSRGLLQPRAPAVCSTERLTRRRAPERARVGPRCSLSPVASSGTRTRGLPDSPLQDEPCPGPTSRRLLSRRQTPGRKET